jgi:hypothetical protein
MASWLKNYLAPLRILVAGIAQVRDDRVNLRNGFTASQVNDSDGKPVLTIDVSTANTSYEPTENTIPIRNGSGTLKGDTITASSYTYVSPVEVQRDEPFQPSSEMLSGDWQWGASEFPTTTVIGAEWICELDLIPDSRIKSVAVVYTPPSGHTLLPAGTDRSRIVLESIADDGTATTVGSLYETAVTVESYEVNRELKLSFDNPLTVFAGVCYRLRFQSEKGDNALTGTVLYRQARWVAEVMKP